MNQGASAGTARSHGWRRTPADEAFLEFAGRFGALTLRQAARHFYGGVMGTAAGRVAKMTHAGLLDRSDNLRWAGTALYPTAAGLAAARVSGHPELRALVPREERMLHRLLVAEVALRARSKGVIVVAERQLRALERATADIGKAEAFADLVGVRTVAREHDPGPVVRPSLDGDDRARWWGIPVGAGEDLHWPDFVIVAGGRLVAAEVEISVKDRVHMLMVLRAYRQAIERGHIAQVLWEVTPDVQIQLEGRRTERGWADGLLQRTGFLPSGKVPDWSVKGQPMVVRPLEAADDGLMYALSQRVLVPSLRTSYRQWMMLRREWTESGSAWDFEGWLMQSSNAARARRP